MLRRIFWTCALLACDSFAQFEYPGCAPFSDRDFKATRLVSAANDPELAEPLKMAFSTDAQGRVEIYFIQRLGKLKYYDPATKTVATIGTLNPQTNNEDGLTGIALDPGFKANHRLYLYYAHSSGFRVSRFEIDPATKILNPNSEKVVLTIPSRRGQAHTSGAMQFDGYGDLWINVGDNRSARLGPANTQDLRGGILRIHPNPDASYAIPRGNLWEFAAGYFDAKGMPAVAAQYRDTTLMRRERYVMGTRDPYTLTLDPVRRWATYGDCGPDEMPHIFQKPPREKWTEEDNVVIEPGFMGWPYWTGYQHVQAVIPAGGYQEPFDGPAEWGDWSTMDTLAPVNDNPKAGIRNLLPAKSGTYVYPHECAMTGPIFRYDGTLKSSVQLPPSLNRVWFVTDFDLGFIKAGKLKDDGKLDGEPVDIFTSMKFHSPLDFQQGPDGALYYLNYSCGEWKLTYPDSCVGITRIEYTGSCRDPKLMPETPTALGRQKTPSAPIRLTAGALTVPYAGGHSLEIVDMQGKTVFALSAEGEKVYALGALLQDKPSGLYFVKLRYAATSMMRKIAFFKNQVY